MDQKRFYHIELIAYWEGRLTSRHLIDAFSISRQQASKDIAAYNQATQTPLRYDVSLKGHIPHPQMQLQHISGLADEYLNWLYRHEEKVLPALAHHLSLPARYVSPVIMRCLVKAIRSQSRVEVDYVSLSQPDREGRILVPHTFVNTGARWHLRAWCEKHSQYRDFVLSRFRGEPELLDRSANGQCDDTAWNTPIELILQPDIRLTPQQQAVIAHDYQMQNNQLRITTRAALASYLLAQMQVNVKLLDGNPLAQQLMLVNLDDIKPWLID